MGRLQRVGDLDVRQDLSFAQREWRVQRAAWCAMGLVVLAALAGLMGGGGPLGRSVAGDSSSTLRAEYERFVRAGSPTSLRLQIGPAARPDGYARVWLDARYLERTRVENFSVTPERVEAAEGRVVFVLRLGRGDTPVPVVVRRRPTRAGIRLLAFGVLGGPGLTVRQVVYP